MKINNLNRVNLNLLYALDALLKCSNVSDAAKSCNVTQSAMSGLLKQLRDILDDPILVKGASGKMYLSNYALTLLEPLREIMMGFSHFF